MSENDSNIDALFTGICAESPPAEQKDRLRNFPDRATLVRFLIEKVEQYSETLRNNDDPGVPENEWGIIHSCHLLGEFKAAEASRSLLEILDLCADDWGLWLRNAALVALRGMGTSAFELVFDRYLRDRRDPERVSMWLHVLTELGVKDDRISHALLEYMRSEAAEAVNLMGDYGDRQFFPIADRYVRALAKYLNDNEINPFAYGARFEDEFVGSYIDCRESLIMLRDEIQTDHPEFDSRVETLDRELLQHADFGRFDRLQPGRNDPCPCGSGKKFKKCCGRT